MGRHQGPEFGLDLLAETPERLTDLEECRAGMVTDLTILIKGMANLAEYNAKVRQTRQTTTQERRMPQVTLPVAAQALEHLKTCGNLEQCLPCKIKSLNLGRGKEGRDIRNGGERGRITCSQEGHQL
jgi:hypothetical protein